MVLNLSHFKESFGRTVLEGMMYGKPSLCYEYGAIKELVTHNQTGFLVPLKDIEQLVFYAMKLVNDRDLLDTFSENAKKKANDEYSIDNYVKTLHNIYQLALRK